MRTFFILLCLTMGHLLHAAASEEPQNTNNDLRITQLLPNLFCHLAVEPKIPENFIVMSPNGVLDPYDWLYWGPKDVLEAYFKDPLSLNTPVLRVKLSANVAQTGPSTFSGDLPQFIESLKRQDPKEVSSTEYQWGSYPVLALKAKVQGHRVVMAWVGLNDKEAGWTLLMNLVYPQTEGHPNKQDNDFWETFLKETKQLPEPDFFKACGQDMQPGYTIINRGGAKLKMTAEKRERDGKLQVVVTPLSSDVEFHYDDMTEGILGSQWKFGQPLVKVYGTIVRRERGNSIIIDYVASILVQTVPEFSINQEKVKDRKDLLIYQKTVGTELFKASSIDGQ